MLRLARPAGQRRWTREAKVVTVIPWIEKTYNRRRRQRALGRHTPIEFETPHQPTAAPA